jgi:hypothetical protein
VVDTRGSGGHGRPLGKHRRVLSLRRLLALGTVAALLLLFLGARQSPRPEWQGFVGVRGMHVSGSHLRVKTLRSPVQFIVQEGSRECCESKRLFCCAAV